MMRTLKVALLCVLAAAPVARAQTLYQENFNDGVANDFTVTSGYWKVLQPVGMSPARPGVYYARVDGAGSTAVSEVGNASWVDYTVELDMLVRGGSDHIVRFRIQDPSNYLQLDVRADPFDDISLDRVVNGVSTPILALTGFTTQSGVWHHIKIEAFGHLLTATFDGLPAGSAFDSSGSPYSDGAIAVVAYSADDTGQDAYVDNVEVTATRPVAVEPQSWGRLKAEYSLSPR